MCEGVKNCPRQDDTGTPTLEMVTKWNHWPEGTIKLHRGPGADCSAACEAKSRPGRDDPAVAVVEVLPLR